MTKGLIGVFAALVVAMPSLFLAAPASAVPAQDEWTVMVYLDGDNNLEISAWRDMNEIVLVGSTKDVNIVVLLDTFSGPANLLYVNQGSTTTVAEWGEVNMGDPATLQSFISQAVALYPAENYALDLWDHGGGIRGICWDDTPTYDYDWLTMPELRSAVAGAGVVLDVVMFDACGMGQVEIAHQFAGYADYTVFSQHMMWASGFPYDTILARLVAEPTMTGRNFALVIAEEFTVYYDAINWNLCTVSVYDMSCVTTVSDAVGTFVSGMIETMSTTYNAYKACRLRADEVGPAVDLIGFAQFVSDNEKVATTVRSAAAAVVSAVDSAIIYEWTSTDCRYLNGLGVWFPVTSETEKYWTPELETMYRSMVFDVATHWADLLDSYYANA